LERGFADACDNVDDDRLLQPYNTNTEVKLGLPFMVPDIIVIVNKFQMRNLIF
jgi:hypothetical protein